jgi:hypothetical protein
MLTVRRHQHILLFDTEEQLEVRYVLSLAHHDVDIYGGGEHIPDGELFIKRNALRLSRKADAGELTADGTVSKPFFLFCENQSDKEDFYFALLKNQERRADASTNPPIPLQFEVKHIIDLVQRLHSSEEHMQTRWFNAMLGRVFLGIYKTPDVENFLRAKITKKISRVKKPSFLSKIVLRHVNMGEGSPYITNPRLKDLTVDGNCTVEADVLYTGNFRLEIAATVRIELGTRFKAREVGLVLAVTVKKVEGHMLLKIKSPPSNRIWMTFETPPRIDMTIEPIVSTRQITYTLILRQIENRIKEVIAESIVMPFWDDISFFPTDGKTWRGGIWVDDTLSHSPTNLETEISEEGDVDELEEFESQQVAAATPAIEKSMSMPALDTSLPKSSSPSNRFSRKAPKSLFNIGTLKGSGSSTSIDAKSLSSDKPKAIRKHSFASPVVSTEFTNADAFISSSPPERSQAASSMAALSAKSQSTSAVSSPADSPSRASSIAKGNAGSQSSTSSRDSVHSEIENDVDAKTRPHVNKKTVEELDAEMAEYFDNLENMRGGPSRKTESPKTLHSRQNSNSSSIKSAEKSETGGGPLQKRMTLNALANATANATASARKWGLNAFQRNGDHSKSGSSDFHETSKPNEPMGRGRPLPPPGMPLPPPDRKTRTAPIPVPKRKPLPPPGLDHQSSEDIHHANETPSAHTKPPPQLPKRRLHMPEPAEYEGLFVVAAPPEEPASPSDDPSKAYRHPWVDDTVDDDDLPAIEQHSHPAPPPLPRRKTGAGNDDEIEPAGPQASSQEAEA